MPPGFLLRAAVAYSHRTGPNLDMLNHLFQMKIRTIASFLDQYYLTNFSTFSYPSLPKQRTSRKQGLEIKPRIDEHQQTARSNIIIIFSFLKKINSNNIRVIQSFHMAHHIL